MHQELSQTVWAPSPFSSFARYCRRHWQVCGWLLFLAVINWPLVHGQVRSELLFLPREIPNGQWWRLITFPWAHLTWYHLLLDAGGFLVLYQGLEEKRFSRRLVYMAGGCAGSLLMGLAFCPDIAVRGLCGLSGMAHGLMAVSALEMLRSGRQRAWGGFVLCILLGKCAWEFATGQVVFGFMHMGLCGQPMAACHAGGVIGAAAAMIGLTPVVRK